MRALMALLVLAAFGIAPLAAADPLAEARRLYNLGQYDTAARYAREALEVPSAVESARLVLGRIHLEQFRRTADPMDLTQARDTLKLVNAEQLDPRERIEFAIGLGECLFLEDRFGTAAEAFERALQGARMLEPPAHDSVLDWWASALDRYALSRPREEREPVYRRIVAKMEEELEIEPSSAPGAYWLAAGLRGSGDLDRAWHAAAAGWVTAMAGRNHGAALRADLDRLMTQAIIPERAARLQPKEPKTAVTSMLAEWDALKTAWSR
jgi:tetratricopeptide (TPR) repeat protein